MNRKNWEDGKGSFLLFLTLRADSQLVSTRIKCKHFCDIAWRCALQLACATFYLQLHVINARTGMRN